MASSGAPERPSLTSLRLALRRLLPVAAVAVVALTLAGTFAAAGDTLGYDFRAYDAAASRVLAGQPLYDVTAGVAGPYGLFLYPPPFVLPILPLALLPVGTATWVWLTLLIACFALGTALLPVRPGVRWSIVLLAGLSVPFVYATKLGQVGSPLYLLFAVGWRWMDRPAALGASAAVGALVKVQPGLVLVWALLVRRWQAAVVGGVVLAGAAVVAMLVLGTGVWSDYLTLLGRISDPITTPHNFTPGAVAYQAGLPRDAASAIQWASTLGAAAVFVVAALRLPPVASYLVAVVVSQLVSPVAWDHYAMLLLLPVAWLLDRGRWWAALIPLLTSIPLLGVAPPAAYPVSYWLTLVALVAVGRGRGAATAHLAATH
jgi:alpha-1,2-mannosyltransferase